MRNTPEELFDRYSEMEPAQQAEFRKLVKGQSNFKRGLSALVKVAEEHGMDAARLAAKGDIEGAKAAAAAHYAKKGGGK